MKRRFKVMMLCGLIGFSTVALATSTVAWFAYVPALDFGTGAGKVNVGAGSETSYYESGSGNSIDDPYIISNRNHLYNLAWLQYMGMYNNPVVQKYFKLKNDIDMNGLTLPPIGTDEYPFLGHFDGNNKTISNLNISNDDPTSNNSDFGLTKPSVSNLQGTTPPNIVGFFGVVGQSPTIEDLTYTSSIVSISNLTLNNLTVKSLTDETLIGLAAGYVDGTMSGVKISGDATINVDGESTTAAMSSITEHISDYGLVGYSTNTSRAGSYSQDISAHFDSDDDEGQGSNWGGSIAIDDLFDRLLSIKNTYAVSNTSFATEITNNYRDGTFYNSETTNTSDTTIYEYNENKNKGTYNNKLGAYQFGDTRTDIHYLSGGHYTKNVNQVKHTARPITDGTNYLSLRLNDNNAVLFTNVTNENSCTYWNIPVGSTGKISSYEQYASSTQYITVVNGVLEITNVQNDAVNWTVTTNNGILSIVYNNNYHLMFDDEWIVRDFTQTSNTYYNISAKNGNTTYYFAPGGTEQTNPYYLKPTSDSNQQIKWSYDDVYNAYYYIRAGASRYLMYGAVSNSVTVIANNIKSSDSSFFRLSSGSISGTSKLTAVSGRYTYYAYYYNNSDGSGWRSRTNGTNPDFTITAISEPINTTDNVQDVTANFYGPDTTPRDDYLDYSGQDVTYFPLNVKDDYTPADNNTGYMIGGSSYTSSNTNYGAGTVRIANFYQLSTNITNFNRSTYKLSNVRTYNASGKVTINDNSNTYQKYEASKEKVENMLKKHSSDNKVYGLHFMNNSISASNLVTAKYAQINTTVYSNYQLPASSIDFNLKERGFVNFFAGTYGNLSGEDTTLIDSFFTLHLVRRNASNAITNIYEIDQILSDGNQDHAYIYKLSNGKYTIPYSYNIYNQRVKYVVDTKTPLANVYPNEEYTLVDNYPNTYSVAFDTSWIKVHDNYDQHVMYYFEIPINCGEFCLGSVENSHFGAYLVYLDIGAFARDNDAIQAYCVTTNVNSLAYPDGVDFAAAGATGVTGGETFCIYIPTDVTGSVSFAITDSNIEITDSSEITTYSYKGTKYSDTTMQNAFTISGDSPGPLVAPPAGGEKLIHITINAIDNSTWYIDILDTLNENGQILSTTYPMIKQGNENRTVADIPEALNEVLDTKIRTLTKIVTLTRNTGTTQFVSTATYDENTRKVVNISISNEDLANTSIEVGGIVTGYTISINNTSVQNGSIYPS